MSSIHALSRTLSDRLDRLHEHLLQLGAGLRESIARAVSGTIADTVRLAVRAALDVVCGPPPITVWRRANHWDNDDPWYEESPTYQEEVTRRPSRWRPALAAAGQALARLWQPGRRSLAIAGAVAAGVAGWLVSRPAAAVAATAILIATTDLSRRVISVLSRIAAPGELTPLHH